MKKYLMILFITSCSLNAAACDICGCGAGNSYIGILPDFNSHIIGMRYRRNMLQSHLGPGGSHTYLTSKEIYRVAELWGGWNLSRKIRVMASLPFSFNERINQSKSDTKNGLGDIVVNGYYEVVNKKSAVGKSSLLVQSLWLGAGIKLPTGKYEPADKSSGSENTNLFQLGTGSTDVLLNAMYDIRLQDAGLNVAAAYKMNTSNRYDYRYGNKFSGTAQLYYKIRINKKVLLAPNAGVQYEYSDKDHDAGTVVDISGGNMIAGTVGIETGFKNIAVGANFQKPFSQKLANNMVRSGNRLMVHLSFTL